MDGCEWKQPVFHYIQCGHLINSRQVHLHRPDQIWLKDYAYCGKFTTNRQIEWSQETTSQKELKEHNFFTQSCNRNAVSSRGGWIITRSKVCFIHDPCLPRHGWVLMAMQSVPITLVLDWNQRNPFYGRHKEPFMSNTKHKQTRKCKFAIVKVPLWSFFDLFSKRSQEDLKDTYQKSIPSQQGQVCRKCGSWMGWSSFCGGPTCPRKKYHYRYRDTSPLLGFSFAHQYYLG